MVTNDRKMFGGKNCPFLLAKLKKTTTMVCIYITHILEKYDVTKKVGE